MAESTTTCGAAAGKSRLSRARDFFAFALIVEDMSGQQRRRARALSCVKIRRTIGIELRERKTAR